MTKKWILLLGYLTAIVLMFIYKDPIVHWLKDDNINNLPLTIGAALLLALIPVIPFGVVAGILGAKYGPFIGGLLNVAVSTTAAVILFTSVRVAFLEQGRRFLAKFKKLDRFTTMMERNAFVAVLTARLIPIIPAPVVNVYAGISQMKLGSYFAATLIGKIPVMFVFALLGEQLFTSMKNAVLTLCFYLIFLLVVFLLHRFYMKRPIRTKS